ncbi:hypothetical protein [Xenophilus sp.]|uniref:hypothetical protein n=1 Tax=Xenophilus sp. TaxID=1873499 RepID=UPI0037DD796E
MRSYVPYCFKYPPLDRAILRARLDGRHGFNRDLVLSGVSEDWFTPSEKLKIFAAYDAGVEARRRGVQCMCDACLIPDRIGENERKRWAYRERRQRELAAKGYAPAEIEKHILEEIDMGAWL